MSLLELDSLVWIHAIAGILLWFAVFNRIGEGVLPAGQRGTTVAHECASLRRGDYPFRGAEESVFVDGAKSGSRATVWPILKPFMR